MINKPEKEVINNIDVPKVGTPPGKFSGAFSMSDIDSLHAKTVSTVEKIEKEQEMKSLKNKLRYTKISESLPKDLKEKIEKLK